MPGTRRPTPTVQEAILLKHSMQAQDCIEEDELSYQARTGLIVCRIQNTLEADPKALIKKEIIYKQGQAINSKTSKRLVTIDAFNLKWYHDEKEL